MSNKTMGGGMSLKEAAEGVKRIVDAAKEKFNTFCEENGISPDDERLSENADEGGTGDEGEGGEEGEGEGSPEEASEDGNVMPTPDNMGGEPGAEAAGGAMEMPPEAQQMPVGDVNAGVPPQGGEMPPEAGAGGEMPALSPEEEEMLRQQQAAAQQAAQQQ